MTSRRAFLVGMSASATLPLLPAPALALAPVAAPPSAAAGLLAFAVGTPGEYDWISVRAKTAEAAWRIWIEETDAIDNLTEGEAEPQFDPDFVQRVPSWDALKGEPKPADWFEAGMGHVCERCGNEAHPDWGARIVADEVVCDGCLTFEDRLLARPDEAIDELADRIAEYGAVEVKASLERRGHWDIVSPDLWSKAVEAGTAP